MMRRSSISTLFPYTTLFRSGVDVGVEDGLVRLEAFARQQLFQRALAEAHIGVDDHPAVVTLDLQGDVFRSEEHTSELQSHSDLVCRLLLEKKKDIEAMKLLA